MQSLRRIVVFGDSYVEGGRRNLKNRNQTLHNGYIKTGKTREPEVEITPYNMCYYLKKELDIPVLNMGKSASSNTNISHSVMRYIQKNDVSGCMFLVCWSILRRFFALNDDGEITHLCPKRIVKNDLKENYPEHDSLMIHRMLTEQAIHSVKSVCADLNIPLLMVNSIDHSFFDKKGIPFVTGRLEDQWIEARKPNSTLFDIVNGRWLRNDMPESCFENKFQSIRRDWEKDSTKYPYLTGCMHPTDEGNRLIAKTLKPYIIKVKEQNERIGSIW